MRCEEGYENGLNCSCAFQWEGGEMPFDLEEKEGVLSRLDRGNRTITLDGRWLFHCSPSLFGAAARYPVGTELLVVYRMDAMGLRQVKSVVLKEKVEPVG